MISRDTGTSDGWASKSFHSSETKSNFSEAVSRRTSGNFSRITAHSIPTFARIGKREGRCVQGLVHSLNAFRERPWAEPRKHKEIDGLWLSQQLRPYNIRPKAMWLDGKTVKGYAKSDFQEVWPRYVSPADFDALLADRGVSDPVGRTVPSAPSSTSAQPM